MPPAEKSPGNPADIASIMNAGMMFLISGRERFLKILKPKNIEEELEAETKINRLILKGIELSYLEKRLRT